MKKITAPAGPVVHGPDNVNDPNTAWWVDGVLYTDDPAQLRRFADLGYPSEDAPGGPPQDYLAGVARLQEQAAQHGLRPRVATGDALDPGHRNYL